VLGQNNENYIDCRNVDVFINENVDVSVTTICSKKSAEVPSSMTVFAIYHSGLVMDSFFRILVNQ
jgi:hypothetical protein